MLSSKTAVAVLSFLVVLFTCNSLYAFKMPLYELKIKIFPENHSIEGKAKITLPKGVQTRLQAKDLSIRKFLINGEEYIPHEILSEDIEPGHSEGYALQNAGVTFDRGTYDIDKGPPRIIEIYYHAIFEPPEQMGTLPVQSSILPPSSKENLGESEKSKRLSRENNRLAAKNIVDESGVLLLFGYYPVIEGLSHYKLTAEIPSDFEAVSGAESVTSIIRRDKKIVQFDFPYPLPGVTLVAGKYLVKAEDFRGIKIKIYLLSEDEKLAIDHIKHAKHYIQLYEPLLGKYPYRTFSIIENRFQIGHAFPTHILMGSETMRLPAMATTRLGHEILHQWFGNYVFVDYGEGNWSEGLTTYLAEHWYESSKGRGSEFRKKILIDYTNDISPDNEVPVKDLIHRECLFSRTIGYTKAAMVFHMLRMGLGDDIFFKAIREFIGSFRYKKASWENMKDAFTSSSGKNLARFFEQWIQRKGVPSIDVKKAEVLFRNRKYLLNLEISQEGDPFNFELPARIKTRSGQEKFTIKVDKKITHWERTFSDRPLELFLDENYDIMRKLTEKEWPPVISAFTGDNEGIVILPENEAELYGEMVDVFRAQNYRVKGVKETKNEDIKNNSILMMSVKNRIYGRLFASRPIPEGGLVVKVYKNPMNSDKVVVLFQARNKKELNKAFRKIFGYGNYSLIVFENGKNIAKEIADSEKGIRIDLKVKVEAVETQKNIGLDEIMEKIKNKKIIYIGETHDQYAHHLMQYEIIKRLAEGNKKLMIGMEMFQRPFQKYLDTYIHAEITEEEFLDKTEYFERWSFDYNLYRDIIHFARANSIPIVALNLRKEIVEKVSKDGIDSLTEDEYAQIPQDMDMTNQDYREYLRKIFSKHSNIKKKDFENFFQSQILWDETMAHTIAEALKRYPTRQMVVLAGNGHLQHAWGIPDRVKRRTHESASIILNDGGEGFDRGIADFVLFPAKIETPKSPKLMVFLKKAEEGVVVEKIIKGGIADKAGLDEGDIIKTIDGRVIDGISDVRIVLLNRKIGDRIEVKVQRKGFIFGMKEIVIEVLL